MNKVSKEMKDTKILFLTNNQNAMKLYHWLEERSTIKLYSDTLQKHQVKLFQPDIIISYNYDYIISDDIIAYMEGGIINLHISYLPWNRGVSPNIWSFIENTPKGVTIHQINSGLDKGKILYQRECAFDIMKESFVTSYQKLNDTIVELFQEKWDEIRTGKYTLEEQRGAGSYHSKKDLDRLKQMIDFDWNNNIAEFLKRYREKLVKKSEKADAVY